MLRSYTFPPTHLPCELDIDIPSQQAQALIIQELVVEGEAHPGVGGARVLAVVLQEGEEEAAVLELGEQHEIAPITEDRVHEETADAEAAGRQAGRHSVRHLSR